MEEICWLANWKFSHRAMILNRRRCEGEFMDGRSRMDVTQSEGDLPDFNQSEH